MSVNKFFLIALGVIVAHQSYAMDLVVGQKRPKVDKNASGPHILDELNKQAAYVEFIKISPANIQDKMLSNIFPTSCVFKNPIAGHVLLSMDDSVDGVLHLARAVKLAGNERTHVPMDIFFVMDTTQQKMTGELNRYFSRNDATSVPVSRAGWFAIQALPQAVKNEFKTKKGDAFLTAQLMRTNTDKSLYVVSLAVGDALMSGAAGGIIGLAGGGASAVQQSVPVVASVILNKVVGTVIEDVKNSAIQSVNSGRVFELATEHADAVLSQRCDQFEDPANIQIKHNIEVLKGAGKVVFTDAVNSGISSVNKEVRAVLQGTYVDNKDNVWDDAVSGATWGSAIGFGFGLARGLYTMNQPIQEQSISKI